MNDQKLLERAARAAGIGPILCYESSRNCLRIGDRKQYRLWRPLDDDGDALRLATATGQAVFTGLPHEAPTYAISDHSKEDFGMDKDAAVRRAIVRAAAAQLKP